MGVNSNTFGKQFNESLSYPPPQFSLAGTSPSTSWTTSVVPESNSTNIDALSSGYKWGASTPLGVNLTYSFPWSNGSNAWFFGYDGGPYSDAREEQAPNRTGLNPTQQNAFKNALEAWANVANITFTQVQDDSRIVGDIRVAFSSADSLSSWWGWATFPNQYWPSGGDIWINFDYSSDSDWSIGSTNYSSLLHEIGHALGLKHPFEDDPRLSSQYDNNLYSVMSYTDAPKNIYASAGYVSGKYDWVKYYVEPETPMVLDIAAIQHLYGKNVSYRSGDDLYTFGKTETFFKTIWDSGGEDTISVSNFSRGCVLSLIPGSYSSIKIDPASDNGGATPTYDGTNNLGIAYECIIENAIGGRGNDLLQGNLVNNSLIGNAGKDTLYGDDGDDTLDGGSGNDILDGGNGLDIAIFGGVRSDYTVSARGSMSFQISDSVINRDGTDSISSIERIVFLNGRLALDLDGNAGQVAKLLGAVFGADSVANAEYVGIGLDLLDGGMSYTDLAALAVSVTGKSSSTDVCNLLWENVIGSPATSADVAPFKAMLDNGRLTVGQLTTLAADTSFNADNIDLVGLTLTGLEFI